MKARKERGHSSPLTYGYFLLHLPPPSLSLFTLYFPKTTVYLVEPSSIHCLYSSWTPSYPHSSACGDPFSWIGGDCTCHFPVGSSLFKYLPPCFPLDSSLSAIVWINTIAPYLYIEKLLGSCDCFNVCGYFPVFSLFQRQNNPPWQLQELVRDQFPWYIIPWWS